MSASSASIAGSSFFYEGRTAKYIHDERINVTILPFLTYPVTDEVEEGLLVGFELATNKAEILMQIVVYGDNSTTPRIINNLTINDLLRLGRGLTPGDAEKTPSGRSRDQMGQQNPLYPWIARWKDDEFIDDTGYTDRYFTLRFTPAVYVPYKRIVINVVNNNPSEEATLITMSVTRIVFEPKDKVDPTNSKPYNEPPPEPEPAVRAPISETIYGSQAPVDIIGEDVEDDRQSVV
jgi:hypothetical protein